MPSPARQAQGIVRNTLYNLAGGFVPIVVTLVTVPLYLHQIGEARYGILAIVWVIFGYFSMFDMGLSRATSNQTARLRGGKTEDRLAVFWTALTMNAVFGVVGGILLWLAGGVLLEQVIKMSPELRTEALAALPWITLAVPVITMSGVLTGTLEGNERFLAINLIKVAGTIMFAVVPLAVALLYGPNLNWLIAAAVLTRVVCAVPLFVAALRTLPRPGIVRPSRHWGKTMLNYGAWVMVTNIVGPILEASDRILIGASLGVTAVTAYTIPFNLADRLRVIPAALAGALFPHLSAKTADQATQTARLSVRMLGKVMTLVTGLGILGMQPFLSLWINAPFAAKAAPVGEIILLGIWINGLAFIPFSLLQSQGRPALVAQFHVLELLPFLGILWLGMKWFGLLGAAMAWAFRVLIDAGILFWFARLAPKALADLWPAPLALASIGTLAATVPDQNPWKWLLGTVLMLGLVVWVWRSEPLLREKVATKYLQLRRVLTKKATTWSRLSMQGGFAPRISIAMATYNGARFIREQLDSLAAQSLPPSELVVTDDGSTDATLDILDEFARASPFPVHIHRNEQRLGYRENFLKAARLCSGDLIAFSDQDDVWSPDKLRFVAPAFADADVLLAVHDAHAVTENLEKITDMSTSNCVVPFTTPSGFAMVFRADLPFATSIALRCSDPNNSGLPMAHDQWISFLATSLGKCRHIRRALVRYRQHGTNTCGFHRNDTNARQRLAMVARTQSSRYLHLNVLAREQAQTLRALIATNALTEPRRVKAEVSIARWERYARLLLLRAEINADNAPFLARQKHFLLALSQFGYARKDLGHKALLKDSFVSIFGAKALSRALMSIE